MEKERRRAVLLALAAATLYALSVPFSKLLLTRFPPVLLAALLYLGAGIGMSAADAAQARFGGRGAGLTRAEAPYLAGMLLLDALAPVLMMLGLRSADAAGASLLSNFEIVATALFAALLFREKISRRLWLSVGLIALSCLLLSFQGGGGLRFSPGSLLVLLSSLCWGLENNCSRKLSGGNAARIAAIKGLFSGGCALLLSRLTGEAFPGWTDVPRALLLGFAAYGLSVFCYVRAQRVLGAARTSAYYASAPFLGAALSLLVLRETLTRAFFPALLLMAAGTALTAEDTFLLRHSHTHTHTLAFSFGGTSHTYTITHTHPHFHPLGAGRTGGGPPGPGPEQ